MFTAETQSTQREKFFLLPVRGRQKKSFAALGEKSDNNEFSASSAPLR